MKYFKYNHKNELNMKLYVNNCNRFGYRKYVKLHGYRRDHRKVKIFDLLELQAAL